MSKDTLSGRSKYSGNAREEVNIDIEEVHVQTWFYLYVTMIT
jgi:hypothetical protein